VSVSHPLQKSTPCSAMLMVCVTSLFQQPGLLRTATGSSSSVLLSQHASIPRPVLQQQPCVLHPLLLQLQHLAEGCQAQAGVKVQRQLHAGGSSRALQGHRHNQAAVKCHIGISHR
jgi:hypothetical protein